MRVFHSKGRKKRRKKFQKLFLRFVLLGCVLAVDLFFGSFSQLPPFQTQQMGKQIWIDSLSCNLFSFISSFLFYFIFYFFFFPFHISLQCSQFSVNSLAPQLLSSLAPKLQIIKIVPYSDKFQVGIKIFLNNSFYILL